MNFGRKSLDDRFYPRVGPKTTGGCRLWLGGTSNGYGAIMVYREGGNGYFTTGAHRAAWTLAYGPIPEGKCVRHRCRNRLCVAPEHLCLGSREWHRELVKVLASQHPSGTQTARLRAKRAKAQYEKMERVFSRSHPLARTSRSGGHLASGSLSGARRRHGRRWT